MMYPVARTRYAALAMVMMAGISLMMALRIDAEGIPIQPETVQRAIDDLRQSFPETYPQGAVFLQRLHQIQADQAAGVAQSVIQQQLAVLQRDALLANPLLDFNQILLVKRSADSPALGLPCNWQGNCSLPRKGYDNEIALLSITPNGSDRKLTTVFHAKKERFLGDVDLDYDAQKFLFSMMGSHDRFQIWEMGVDGSGLRQVTRGEEPDVDNYDPCYLPDGRILYDTTAFYHGVPCVTGSDAVANLCRMDADGGNMRQLCFDQDHDWCPTVLSSGRILYTRWEYEDIPHSNSRLLFQMNPDGTGQSEFYKSNSYWPTSIMYARPIPGFPTRVVAIATGHHGVRRMGELIILDTALGRQEAEGVVQQIPGYGKKVEPIVKDNLVDDVWPKFLHPYPLSDKYFLVACQPTPESLWGIYLVDIFDNMLLIKEESGHALFEPIPLRKTPRPPVIPDMIKPDQKTGTVYLADIYAGNGLKGVPRGTVKSLRVYTYTYGYRGMGGLMGVIGMDGPWDIKRVLGTVPVEEDGSAYFEVPANMPIAIQPLDVGGQAVQLMRSWFTAMPGEAVSCVGCHERQSMTPSAAVGSAARHAPVAITPWHGPTRGFSFEREVQPVLDASCVPCHNGTTPPDLRGTPITDWKSDYPGAGCAPNAGKFSTSYAELHRYVRRPGIESLYYLLSPMEYHASTTELVQMLRQGHCEVQLSPEAWDRLITWIDLNTPYHGTWTEIVGPDKIRQVADRRRELYKKYAGMDDDPEIIQPSPAVVALPLLQSQSHPPKTGTTSPLDSTPFKQRTLDLGEGVTMDLIQLPGGSWMGRCEVSNRQYARFDPGHDSGMQSMHSYQFGYLGYPMNEPDQPVVRVSCDEAEAFCAWLSKQTGETFTLPMDDQWEQACRAGTSTPFYYGDRDTDFSPYANLADATLSEFARNTYIQVNLLSNPNKYDDWIPKDARFRDNGLTTMPIGSYKPNSLGLCDMHGNVSEWTKWGAVCGGSWYDRPIHSTASFRLKYPTWQKVFNVGFRVYSPHPRAF